MRQQPRGRSNQGRAATGMVDPSAKRWHWGQRWNKQRNQHAKRDQRRAATGAKSSRAKQWHWKQLRGGHTAAQRQRRGNWRWEHSRPQRFPGHGTSNGSKAGKTAGRGVDNNTREGTAASAAIRRISVGDGDIEGSGVPGPGSNFGCSLPLLRMQGHRERPRRKPALARAVAGYLLFLVVVQHSRRRLRRLECVATTIDLPILPGVSIETCKSRLSSSMSTNSAVACGKILATLLRAPTILDPRASTCLTTEI